MIVLAFWVIGGALMVALLALAITSMREGHRRATVISFALLGAFALAWIVVRVGWPATPEGLGIACLAVVLVAALFFAPVGATHRLRVTRVDERVDERDVVFSREEYRPGTEKYRAYYAMRPENEEPDDQLRALPGLLEPGGRFYDPAGSKHVEDIFRVIEHLLMRVDGPKAPERVQIGAAEATRLLKGLVLHLGADDVGVTQLNPMWVYSHVGRGPEPWGQGIENRHSFAVCFALEMDYDRVQGAPDLRITEESATQYLKGAQISIALAEYIRNLGYAARAHVAGSNYQVILPPIAHDAGLGELGRMGYLIHPRLGARMRLGVVTTDLALIADQPIVFGVQDFCATCKKCGYNCPSGAIPIGTRTWVRGVEKWPLAAERCLHYWRVAGTDCGLCMKVCPYSHPPTLVHNLVRRGIERSAFARTLAVWGDDLIYGRRPPHD